MEIEDINRLKSNAFNNSLVIAFLYVGLGTIAAISVYPDSLLYGDWVYIGLLLTLPVSIVSFAVMYADPSGYVAVLVVQLITFLLFWLIVYRYLLKRYRKQLVG